VYFKKLTQHTPRILARSAIRTHQRDNNYDTIACKQTGDEGHAPYIAHSVFRTESQSVRQILTNDIAIEHFDTPATPKKPQR
jgi:hypothetical protein